MKSLFTELIDRLKSLMDSVDKTTLYKEGKVDGFNISIREIESRIQEVSTLSSIEQIKYIPDKILNIIETMKIKVGLKIDDDFMPMDVYITKRADDPRMYAVLIGNNRMDNKGEISCEPTPSNRNKEYIKAHSFDTIQEAWECFNRYYK